MSTIYEAMKEHIKACQRNYKDEVLFGKRCLETVNLFYDKKDKIFHLQFKDGRLPCMMIQNTKKGFYIIQGEAILEYFYDSYEGWYIQSYHHGHKNKHQYTCEAATKYKQCDYGLQLNTAMANMVFNYNGN